MKKLFLTPLIFAANKASAASLLTVPTSTPSDALASVSDTLADPGTLLIIGAVIALPVVFWVIKKIAGLFPKTIGAGYDNYDRKFLVKRRGGRKYRVYDQV